MHRDKCSKEEAGSKIAAQMPLDQKRRLAQYTISNSGSLQDTDAQVCTLMVVDCGFTPIQFCFVMYSTSCVQVRQLLKVLKRSNRWRMWSTSPHAFILNPIGRLLLKKDK